MIHSLDDLRVVLSPGLDEAPVLDRMCSQFVLTLTMRHIGRFNLRRDWSSLLSLTGRHLVWPVSVLARLREFLKTRCRGNEQWRGHEALGDDAFIERHGAWRGPYEEVTLFFYVDEYIKDAPKDLLTVLATTCDWLARRLKKESTLVQKNIDSLAGLLVPCWTYFVALPHPVDPLTGRARGELAAGDRVILSSYAAFGNSPRLQITQ